jgi:hypothetical protein
MSHVILILIVQTCFSAMAQAQSPNLIGRWNIEIIFADGNNPALRFDAQGDGKGTLKWTLLSLCGGPETEFELLGETGPLCQ